MKGEGNIMKATNEMVETNEKAIKNEKVVKENNKVCAILHTITASVWMLIVIMKVYGIVSYGEKAGWSLVSAISMVIVFGSCAISYFCKYKKEKRENGGE